MVWHWLTIFCTWVYHHETMCGVNSWSRYDLELWPQGQIYRVFDMFSCPAHNYFWGWHWLTIFGTWVYHHKMMCRVHSWSWYDLERWPQGHIHRVLNMFLCQADSYFYFFIYIGLPYLAHRSITMRVWVKYMIIILIRSWTLTSRSNL